MQQLPGIPTLLVILHSWKRCSIGLLILLNETTGQQHRCLLSFLNLAGKPSLIVGEIVAYHSCRNVFTVWLVIPPHLFVILPSPLVQLMATHFVCCPLEPILTSTPSILVPLLTGMPSRHLWSLVLPLIRSAVPYIPAWPTPSNHTPIVAVTGGNPWPAITEEPKNHGTVILVLSHSHHAYQFWCDSHSSFGVSRNIFFGWLIIAKILLLQHNQHFYIDAEPGQGELHAEPHVWPISCHVTSLSRQEPEEELNKLLLMKVSDRDRNVKVKMLVVYLYWSNSFGVC